MTILAPATPPLLCSRNPATRRRSWRERRRPSAYLRAIFPDWRAVGSTSVLHEQRGGYAHNLASLRGLLRLATRAGARVLSGVTVMGFEAGAGGVNAVVTDGGRVRCRRVVVAAGPWVRDLRGMLDLPDRVEVLGPEGRPTEPMWHYLALQEGTLMVDPGLLTDTTGAMSPVVHLDSDARSWTATATWSPTRCEASPSSPTRTSAASKVGRPPAGAAPRRRRRHRPLRPGQPGLRRRPRLRPDVDRRAGALYDALRGDRARVLRPALRRGRLLHARQLPPSSTPSRATSRSSPTPTTAYKMVGVGALAAAELLGEPQPLLGPFRLDRYAAGRLHPVSHSPFPWS